MKRATALKDKRRSSARLDLGLNSILGSVEESVQSPLLSTAAPTAAAGEGPCADTQEPNFILIPQTSASESQVTEPDSAEAESQEPLVEPPIKSEFEKLFELEDLPELVNLCESRLSKATGRATAEELEPRLWWIKAQLAQGGMPLSAVSAPLESASEGLLEARSSKALGEESLSRLSNMCEEVLSQVSARLIEQGERQTALRFLEREYRLNDAAAPRLRELLELELSELKDSVHAKHNAKQRNRVAKLESLLSELPKVQKTPTKKQDETELGSSEPKAKKSEPRARGLFSRVRIARSVGAIAAVLALVLGGRFAARALFLEPDPALASGQLQTTVSPDIKLPEVRRVAGLSNLDALFYDMDNAKANYSGKQATAAKSIEPARASPQPEVSAARPAERRDAKAIVNTSAPIEGPEFQNLSDERDSASLERSQDLFGTAGRAPERVQAYEVTKFEADKLYVVLVKTKVMARPSFQTAALAELEPGDKVLVESRLGPWLKLRSKQGQSGFILAQDANLSSK